MINLKIFTQTVKWSLTKRCTVYTRENQHLETIWPFQEYLQLDLPPWPSRLAQVHLLPGRKWKCPRLVNLVLLHWLQPMQTMPHPIVVPSQSIYIALFYTDKLLTLNPCSQNIYQTQSAHILHWCTHKSIWSLCRGLWHCRYCHVSLL